MESNFKALLTLESFLTYENIVELKDDFITKNIPHEEQPLNLIPEKGIFQYYDSFSNEVIQVNFSNELKELLWKITNNIKEEIENSIIFFTPLQKRKYFENIINTFNYISEKKSKTITTFPVCIKPFDEIKNYLLEKHGFNYAEPLINPSHFTLNPKYKKSDLENIYCFLVDNVYIDDEELDFNDFYSILNDLDTTLKLKFQSSSEIASLILHELGKLFLDFNRKRIGESERFLTKSGKRLTQTNFDSAYNRIKSKENKDKRKIESFFSNNFPK